MKRLNEHLAKKDFDLDILSKKIKRKASSLDKQAKKLLKYSKRLNSIDHKT